MSDRIGGLRRKMEKQADDLDKGFQIAKLKDRIEKLEARTKWQPIETAPKDGEDILLYEPRDDKYAFEIGFFEGENWYGYDYIYTIYPTHWMPPPEPPEALKEQSDE